MPTYDYRCTDCDEVFETAHGVDETVDACPGCGGKVRRLFHPVGIIFKGSGFYKTDNRSASGNGGDGRKPEKPEKELDKTGGKSPDKESKPPRKEEAGV